MKQALNNHILLPFLAGMVGVGLSMALRGTFSLLQFIQIAFKLSLIFAAIIVFCLFLTWLLYGNREEDERHDL